MASLLKVDKLDPQSGTALEIGTSGDTITVPSGATLDISASTLTPPATMPASSGVNLTALNASNLGSGTVPAARLSGLGKIAQIVRGYATSVTNTSSASFTHYSGIDLDITPTSATNRVICWFSSTFDNNAAGRQGDISCWREIGASNVLLVDPMQEPAYTVSSTRIVGTASWVFVDEPGTTDTVRYRPVVRSNTGNQVGLGGFATTLVLMEADFGD